MLARFVGKIFGKRTKIEEKLGIFLVVVVASTAVVIPCSLKH